MASNRRTQRKLSLKLAKFNQPTESKTIWTTDVKATLDVIVRLNEADAAIRIREGKNSTSQSHQEDLEILGLQSKPRNQIEEKRKMNTKRQQKEQPIAKTAAKNN